MNGIKKKTKWNKKVEKENRDGKERKWPYESWERVKLENRVVKVK